MKVVEIFKSIDGEGLRTGVVTTFIRLFGCNLRCKYCDTKYSYEDNANYTHMSIEEIIEKVKELGCMHITVTGGEPLKHRDINFLLKELVSLGYVVNIETNGSVDLTPYYETEPFAAIQGSEKPVYKLKPEYCSNGVLFFTIDYKTKASGMTKYMVKENFTTGRTNMVYKFVVGSKSDLKQAENILQDLVICEDTEVYLSPVFESIEPKEIVEYMIDHKLNEIFPGLKCQVQLHKIIWDPQERGV